MYIKGEAEHEIFIIIGIIVILVLLIPIILPTVQKIITSYALDSPDIVSKDLGSLISIASASPKDITIEYNTPAGNSYDVTLENRMLKISGKVGNEEREVSTPITIDAQGSFSDEKDFVIKKKTEG